MQTTLALAVAESCLEFEHRDLHWGNLLVKKVPDSTSQVFCLRGQNWNVRSPGIKICLIDFTLSRLLGCNGTVKCSNLATEDMSWLFTQIEEVVNPQVWSRPC
jgi:serine/threonine-protein kinase haspin